MKSALIATIICYFLAIGQGLPQGYLHTPGGIAHHETCVHSVPLGARLEQLKDGSFLVHVERDGEMISTPIQKCTKPFLRLKKQDTSGPNVYQDGYILDAHDYFKCDNCPPLYNQKRQQNVEVGFLGGQWKVPQNPPQTGALLYLWNGIVSSSGDDVLQPVLQWGLGPAGGGNYWGFASWYVGPAGAFHSQYDTNIAPGTVITGNTKLLGDQEWLIEGLYNSKNISYSISLAQAGQQFGVYLALEGYSVTSCEQFPSDGQCAFVNQKIMNIQGSPLAPTWTKDIFYQGECGEDVQVVSATNVNLVWSNSNSTYFV